MEKLRSSIWAIQHLAMYISNTRDSIHNFNRQLTENYGIAGETYQMSCAADNEACNIVVLQNVTSYLKIHQPGALDTLLVTSNFSSEGFPLSLLAAATPNSRLTLDVLDAFGLIAVADTAMCRLDSNLLELLPMLVDEEERKLPCEKAVSAVAKAFPSGDYESWAQCEALLPQAVIILKNDQENESVVALLMKVVCYLTLRSRYTEANSYMEKLRLMCLRLYEGSDPRIIDTFYQSALLMFLMGRFHDARSDISYALELAESSDRNFVTLQCRACLGEILRRLGDYMESERLLRRTLAAAQEHLPADHPFIFATMHDLGGVLLALGSREEGKSMIQGALTRQMVVLLPGDPKLLRSKRSWINILLVDSQLEEGSHLVAEALKECERHLGPQHVESIFMSFLHCTFLQHQGRPRECHDIFRKGLEDLKIILDPSHPDMLATMEQMASILQSLGNYGEAVNLLEQIYECRVQVSGVHHSDTLKALELHAWALCKAGRCVEAVKPLETALGHWQQSISSGQSKDEMDLLDCKTSLAYALSQQNRHEQAEPMFWEALTECRCLLGPANHRTLRILILMADYFLHKLHRTEEAETLLRTAMKLREQTLGPKHLDNYLNLRQLGECERYKRNFQTAIRYFQQALEFYQKNLGEDHPVTKDCQGELQEALYEYVREMVAAPTRTYHRPLSTRELTALARRTSAAMGSSVLPQVTAADSRGPLSGPAHFPKRPFDRRPSDLCLSCKRITIATLLQAKASIIGAADGDDTVCPSEGSFPITLTFDSPFTCSQRCPMCKLILGPLADEQLNLSLMLLTLAEDKNSERFRFVYVTRESDYRKYEHRLLTFAEPSSFAARYITGRALRDPISSEALATIRWWLQRCDECHSSCWIDLSGQKIDELPELPTRVIRIGSTGEGLRLLPSNGQHGRYVALSHCWGGQHQYLVASKSNIERLQECIDAKGLSKTIRDAIYMTQVLGIQYLWVDSLCIIQDDEQDWLREAPKMGSVYSRAYVTLAASASINGSKGLFAPLQSEDIVQLPCTPGNATDGYMYFAPETIYFSELEDGPLNRRAWVLQERLLSRRTIHFSATQTYWECRRDYRAENHSPHDRAIDSSPRGSELHFALDKFKVSGGVDPSRISASSAGLAAPKDELYLDRSYSAAYDLQGFWRNTVTFYSQCGLTNSSDKLVALLGLATKIHERTGIQYHCGHWFDFTIDTLAGLLWSACQKPMSRPAKPRAPSWSWASLDGATEFIPDQLDMSRMEEQLSDLKILPTLPPQSFDPFEHVSLELLGLVKPIARCICVHYPSGQRIHNGPYPRSRYYHLGDTCYPEFDWYPSPQQELGGEDKSFEFQSEFHARLSPNAPPLSHPDGGDSHVHIPAAGPLSTPGIGWVCFDCTDTEPEDFELVCVCTREFVVRSRQTVSQYLCLAVCKTVDNSENVEYRRVGVAQVHQKGWFEDAMEKVTTLV